MLKVMVLKRFSRSLLGCPASIQLLITVPCEGERQRVSEEGTKEQTILSFVI
jgi:hypothetical protein